MKLHILGIAGTFMGGVAALARELGHEVEGSDQAVYPPMSTQLETLGIALRQGYDPANVSPDCDVVVVGNALSRGNPAVEQVLDDGRAYTSGAQWLSEQVLPGRDTIAVAGTHGKTTTTTLLAFLLDAAGLDPGFLIGGVAPDFGVSARLGGPGSRLPAPGSRPPFVVEADEYDTAFFDKRSKFVHYRPRIAILNNLEYDHADIFPDVAAIQRQFHHLVRTVPGNGRLIVNAEDARLAEVLAMGCWTPVETFGIDAGDWRARLLSADGSAFAVTHVGEPVGDIRWNLTGRHNVMNALAALAAAHAAGVGVHHREVGADVGREVGLVDHEQVALGDAGAALARDLLAGGHVDHVDGEVRQLRAEGGREVVAAGLHEHDVRLGKLGQHAVDGLQVDRGVLADRRVRAAAGFHADDPLRRQGLVAHQELGVFLGVDVVGHHGEVVALAQGVAQRQGQGGLAGAHRAADADAQGLGVHAGFS